ncbi:hypothetical protein AKG08_15055 [Achromobacter piechaudii]|nr:hypothetical protein AKG08_15055 [Achromobacter piechaudii]
MIRHLDLAASVTLAGSAVAAPSFNCAKASAPFEKSRCGNWMLGDQHAVRRPAFGHAFAPGVSESHQSAARAGLCR